jgi:hypothetical protein
MSRHDIQMYRIKSRLVRRGAWIKSKGSLETVVLAFSSPAEEIMRLHSCTTFGAFVRDPRLRRRPSARHAHRERYPARTNLPGSA